MEIRLKRLRLKNFKGIKDFEMDVDGKNGDVFGDNATGKTTLFDAFTWLLFDKDSSNRKDFQIKTLDSDNNVIHGLDHVVEAELIVDNESLVLKKLYKEKWTKRRGEAEKTMTGHETEHWINEVPVKKNEYTSKISELINEDIFKLITNPQYFNNHLKWTDRRKILIEIAGGDISDEMIYASSDKLQELQNVIGDKSIEDYNKIIRERIKRLNDEIKQIPIRIDEINNNLPALEANIDFDVLENKKTELQGKVKSIEMQLLDVSKIADSYKRKQNELFKLKNILISIKADIEKEANIEVNELNMKKQDISFEIKGLEQEIESNKRRGIDLKEQIDSLDKELEDLRSKWAEVNKEKFEMKDEVFSCPTCGQDLPETDKEAKIIEMRSNFEAVKQKKIDEIDREGKQKKERQEQIKKRIADISIMDIKMLEKIDDSKKELLQIDEKLRNTEVNINYEDNKEYLELIKKIKAMEDALNNQEDLSTEQLLNEKKSINSEIDSINITLNSKKVIEQSKGRIEELKKKEREIADQINKFEKHKFLIEEFTKAKVDILEYNINSKFKHVKFKLFNTLVNGAIEECCDTLINGVPFTDANNAAKNNAGIDIINTLTIHYDIEAPIFIDNRESINELIDTNSQIINLRVSTDEKLRVEVNNNEQRLKAS